MTCNRRNVSYDGNVGYMDKQRRRAYRRILAGLRYHKGEKMSFVTFGFKRGSAIDVRTVLKMLTTWIKRNTGERIDYFRVKVRENLSPDAKYRIHVHMIWNAPYIKQSKILEQIQKYIGEQGSVDIRLLQGSDKKSARYLMQYLGNQYGELRFDMSDNWLPEGYESVWKEIRHDFYEHVSLGIRKPLDCGEKVLKLMSQSSEEWKKEGVIENMNAWLDEQRTKGNFEQLRLDKNGEVWSYG